MSKNVTIQENGVGYDLALDALRVPAHGGGSVDLVPADGKNLVKLVVRQNGTYRASDFNAYGIAEVKVACTRSGGNATATAAERAVKGAFNPSIAEGGLSRAFSAELIETPLTAGGDCRWVPKDAVRLSTKSINVDNRTYKASDDGYFGYSEVTVSGISISKTTDAGGNEVVTHTDGAGTVTQIVPSRIRIVTPPGFTGPYNDNTAISVGGMVVKAYRGDGALWTDANHPNGVIPLSEISIDPTVAQSGSGKSYGTATSSLIDDMDFMKNPFPTGSPTSQFRYAYAGKDWTATITWETQGAEAITGAMTRFEPGFSLAINAIAASKSPLSIRYVEQTHDNKTGEDSTTYGQWSSSFAFTYAGKTVYYTNAGVISGYTDVTPCCANDVFYTNNTENVQKIAWTMVYGEVTEGGYLVTVQWPRPGDNEVLRDTFEITVVDARTGGHGED